MNNCEITGKLKSTEIIDWLEMLKSTFNWELNQTKNTISISGNPC